MTDTFLTPEEVRTLTGYRQPRRQWDRLLELGFQPVGRGRGFPVSIPRAHLESRVANQGEGAYSSDVPGMNLDFSGLNRRR